VGGLGDLLAAAALANRKEGQEATKERLPPALPHDLGGSCRREEITQAFSFGKP
jgi:hypothetical protein